MRPSPRRFSAWGLAVVMKWLQLGNARNMLMTVNIKLSIIVIAEIIPSTVAFFCPLTQVSGMIQKSACKMGHKYGGGNLKKKNIKTLYKTVQSRALVLTTATGPVNGARYICISCENGLGVWSCAFYRVIRGCAADYHVLKIEHSSSGRVRVPLPIVVQTTCSHSTWWEIRSHEHYIIYSQRKHQ